MDDAGAWALSTQPGFRVNQQVVDSKLSTLLGEGLRELALDLSAAQQRALLGHVALLEKWNKTYNLTAVREPHRMVALHTLDSLAVIPYIDAKEILDVGTGGGFPGIPLAIAMPESNITMLDSLQKKTIFVRQVIAELALKNARIACDRVERYGPSVQFEAVISRAFAELGDFVTGAGHLIGPQGRIFAMKGAYPHDEIARLPAPYRVERVIELFVPQVEGQRHLVVLKKV
jgi:16S rRNA (guanine527-N7)-methyltransferase